MDEDLKVHLAAIFGVLMVNAKYSAFSFFQARKGAPLTVEEMQEVADGVNGEIGTASRDAVRLLGGE